jgi:hypothetical protein
VAPPPRTLWVVANGHGEDAIAAALVRACAARLPDWRFVAPVVGVGGAFEAMGVPIGRDRAAGCPRTG